ncbi:MAG: hypothetical protein QOJ07_1443 [Thermoleophilaceae bacterium]|jgi:hypothetical protein|nr:hypothetical protein [Thermoleophilaceae bacterium]
MMQRVWALRVVAVVIAAGGAVLSTAVLDPDSPAVSTVLLVACLALGMYLAYLSTKIKA